MSGFFIGDSKMATIRTQGTELFFAAGTPIAVMKMTCPTGISGLGGAREQIDTTCLDNKEDRTYVGGLGNPGTVSVPFVFHPDSADQQALFGLKESGIDVNWVIAASDGVAAATLGTGDELEPPTDRTTFQFTAYVADITVDIATNEVVRGTMELQRSGKVVLTGKA